MVLTIVDLKGRVVYQDELDLSGLQEGTYGCQLTVCGKTKCTRMLLVAH